MSALRVLGAPAWNRIPNDGIHLVVRCALASTSQLFVLSDERTTADFDSRSTFTAAVAAQLPSAYHQRDRPDPAARHVRSVTPQVSGSNFIVSVR